MGDSEEKLMKAIKHYQDSLERHFKTGNSEKLLHAIEKLSRLPIRLSHLRETGIGRTVNGLKRFEGSVGENAKTLVEKWKLMAQMEEDEERRLEEQQQQQQEAMENEVADDEPDPESLHIAEQEPDDSDKSSKVENNISSHRKSGSSYKSSHSNSSSNRDRRSRSREKASSKRRRSSNGSSDSNSDSRNKSKKHKSESKPRNQDSSDKESGSSESDSSRDSSPRRSNRSSSSSSSSNESSSDSEHSSSEESSSSNSDDGRRHASNSHHKNDKKPNRRRSSTAESDSDSRLAKSKKSSSDSDKDSKTKRSNKSRERSKDRSSSSNSKSKYKDKSDKHRSDKESSSKKDTSSSHNSKSKSSERAKHDSREKEKSKSRDSDKGSKRLEKHDDKKREDPKKESSRSHSSKSSDDKKRPEESSSEKHRSSSSRSSHDKKRPKESSPEKHSHDKKKSEEVSPEKESRKHKNESSDSKSSKHRNHEHSSRRSRDKTEKERDKKDKSETEKSNKSKYKEKDKSKTTTHTASSTKKPSQKLLDGIDSGSGTSFADVLGMLEAPPVYKGKKKSIGPEEKSYSATSSSGASKNRSSTECSSSAKDNGEVPNLLKDPGNLEPLDLNISSLLPAITPNYRPLGTSLDNHSKKPWSDEEALTRVISAKHQRTKVFSGNRSLYSTVPSLFELCSRILQDNLDALEYTGGVPYSILKPILEKASPDQLYQLEFHNPYLIEDSDELWQLHCQKEFRNKRREELESWREMYMRCLDEREAKLKALTANIKQSQDKSLPVRQTKLAYVDSVAKPPRNIARKQAKNGTASDLKRPSQTPTERLNQLAKTEEAAKVAVPNPGRAAANNRSSSSSSHLKPKKAPLMAKTLSLLKNRFGRR